MDLDMTATPSPPDRRVPLESLPGHPQFVRLGDVPGVLVDLRYAGTDNVFGRAVYDGLDCAWVHVDAAGALGAAVDWLRRHAPGERLLVLDALRPHRVQALLWQALDPALRRYLADPAVGSIHSHGLAIDATLVDAQGHELDMGSGFDEMTERSHPSLEAEQLAAGALTGAQVAARQRLRDAMAAGGFQGVGHEWWHFDLHDRDTVRATGVRVE
jgi:D-alanyl-D-alanine dipeptidase